MAYTMERLTNALAVFNGSHTHQAKVGFISGLIEDHLSSNSIYNLRQVELTTTTNTSRLWNEEEDDDAEYDPNKNRPLHVNHGVKSRHPKKSECPDGNSIRRSSTKLARNTNKQKGCFGDSPGHLTMHFTSHAAKEKLKEFAVLHGTGYALPVGAGADPERPIIEEHLLVHINQVPLTPMEQLARQRKFEAEFEAGRSLRNRVVELKPRNRDTCWPCKAVEKKTRLGNRADPREQSDKPKLSYKDEQQVERSQTSHGELRNSWTQPPYDRAPTSVALVPTAKGDAGDKSLATRIVSTMWTHPINFACRGESPPFQKDAMPCHFCNDFRYGMLGCGRAKVMEIQQVDQIVYEETSTVKRYLAWTSVKAEVFNVGMYRRDATPHPDAKFFEANNPDGEKARRAAAEAAVADMIDWFQDKANKVAILDATNSTKSRRAWIYEKLQAANILPLYVESKCDDDKIITANILEVKTTSPDYVGQDPEEAVRDFRNRIKNYEKVYQTLDESERHYTYVKVTDVGHQVIVNKIQDYLQSRLVYFLSNLHIKPRSIWISRHGESMYNLNGRIGGDADISDRGEAYARQLPDLVRKSGIPKDQPLTVWTSTLKRTSQTARHLLEEMGWKKLEWKALDELESGVCDGMTYAEIEQKFPEDFAARDEDKFNYRYRGGESYRDVVIRLEPIIMELERSENIIIITHQAVVRCIYAYFMGSDQSESPWLEVPLHTLIKLTPKAYGTEKELFKADIPAVSTWRGKGSSARHNSESVPTISIASG